MIQYDKEKVPVKYLIGFSRTPAVEDILYEIAKYMGDNGKDSFSKTDISLYTKTRVSDTIEMDIAEMERKGYIAPVTKKTYGIVSVPWV